MMMIRIKIEDKDKDKNGEEPPIFADTPYDKEVLHITTDYLQMAKDLKTVKK